MKTRFRSGSSPEGLSLAPPKSLAGPLCKRYAIRHCPASCFRKKARGHSPLTACWHVVSGTVSLPSQGCFSTFPHGTGALSVTRECLALAGGPADFRQNSTCSVVLGNSLHGVSSGVAYGAFALCGAPFQALPLPARLITPRQVRCPAQVSPVTPTLQRQRACTASV